MAELRLGLIGCGGIGEVHAGCVAKIPQGEFIAYCDIDEAVAKRALDKFGGEYATTEADKLFADDRLDAIYIATHHDSHAPLVIAAAKAAKHIFIEKPLALTIAECEAVAEAVATAGVYLMPAFKMRYYPLIRMAHEFIPAPQVLVGQMMDRRWADDAWFQDPVKGGANVHSQGCHTTDILRYLAGSEPVRIWAAGGTLTHPDHPCIDQCVASIEFVNGHVASWIQGDVALPQLVSKFYFELFGDGKSVQLHDRLKRATFFDGEKTWTEQRDKEEGFQLENVEFLTALAAGREPQLTVHDGIQATRIVLAAQRAIKTGQVQEL
ncbi:MAG: Gfo/Idh/MocA family oxidoreductase [Phycisphaerae bacterium]|nr:Gfo/Idh/MocA family oxidoreductase [Phycisphaerae bacterium]